MIFTTNGDVIENSWVGGDDVLFITGSNSHEFWKRAKEYEQYCFVHDIPVISVDNNLEHSVLMEYARTCRCVVTASGVTAKEMIYQAVPCILIQTADNQFTNYAHFTIKQPMAFGLTIEPEIISNTNRLKQLSDSIKKTRKLAIPHMLDIIERVYEINS